MKRRRIIETPERITFSYPVAGAGSRFLAYVIDLLVQVAIVIALLFIAGLLSVNYAEVTGDFTAGFFLLLYFLLQWWYFLLFEWFLDGRSPGQNGPENPGYPRRRNALRFPRPGSPEFSQGR
jgi:uncharacterized RDD family membrane protein YckC